MPSPILNFRERKRNILWMWDVFYAYLLSCALFMRDVLILPSSDFFWA